MSMDPPYLLPGDWSAFKEYIVVCPVCDGFWSASSLGEWQDLMVCHPCWASIMYEPADLSDCQVCETPILKGVCACGGRPSVE